MSDLQLDQINAEIDSIRKDPKYMALKNKKRSAQEAERFNVYLRQLQRLETQRQERLAGHDVVVDKSPNDAPFISAKPVWRNQPVKVAHRNQTEGHVSKNWTRNAVALMDAHPKADPKTVEPPSEEPPVEPYQPPVVGHKEVTGGRLAVRRLLRRKNRTPAELERFKERTRAQIEKESRGGVPTVTPREHVEIAEQEFQSTTRKTAPPNKRKIFRFKDQLPTDSKNTNVVESDHNKSDADVSGDNEDDNIDVTDDADEADEVTVNEFNKYLDGEVIDDLDD